MSFDPEIAIRYTWEIIGIVWLVGLVFTKRTLRSQPYRTRIFHLGLMAVSIVLMAGNWSRGGWLAMRFIPASYDIALAGFVLTTAGCAFAIWARIALGTNWSGRATVKADHELITRGPYSLTRHPIYTGLVTALAGSALAGGEWRFLLALVVILLALLVKMSQEERLMMQTFPEAYPGYRRQVKALIPGVF